ncbi:insulinase family protein [Shewanella algae]|uniref:M16 family metallopeptidase n=1 Tax=Shewanella algae TaxID=38313 RepID=UPI0030041636
MKPLIVCLLAGLLLACQSTTEPKPESQQHSTSQQPLAEGSLPLRPDLQTYTLANGLQVMLLPRKDPRQNVELRLLVKAGSLQETDAQQGLAHFVEHMAFKGTEAFADQQSFKQLEQQGISLGSHVNAVTSFASTVYKLSLPAPDEQQVALGLKILSQWGHKLTFDPQAFEREREVIIEEWRLRQGLGQRINSALEQLRYQGSELAERNPIGLPEVIRNAPVTLAKQYYQDWYQPQNMVLMMAGEFDVEDARQHIEHFFGPMAKGDSKVAADWGRFDSSAAEVQLQTVLDPEQSQRFIQLMLQQPMPAPLNSVNGQWRDLLDRLWLAVLNRRLGLMVDEQLFAKAQLGDQSAVLSPSRIQHLAILHPLDADYGTALQRFATELKRLASQGVSQAELDAVKAPLLARLQQQALSESRYDSGYLLEQLTNAVSFQMPMLNKQQEWQMTQTFLAEVTPEHLQAAVQSLLQQAEVKIALIGPDTDAEKLNKNNLLTAWQQGLASTPGAFALKPRQLTLDLTPPAMNKVVDRALLPALGALPKVRSERWQLANGLTLLLHSDPMLTDNIQLDLRLPGGRSLENHNTKGYVSQALYLPSSCGIGEYSGRDLLALQKQYGISITPYAELLHHGLRGQASADTLAPLLKLFALRLTQPKYCQEALSRQLQAIQQQRNHMPAERRFMDAITQAAFENGELLLMQGSEPASELARLEQLDRQLLGDPGAMVLSISGNLPLKQLGEQANLWLGHLAKQDGKTAQSWADRNIRPKAKSMERRYPWSSSPKTMVQIQYSQDAKWSAANSMAMQLIEQVLNQRLRQKLRTEASGVYVIQMSQLLARDPAAYYLGRLNFTAAPERAEALAADADAVVQHLVREGMSVAEFKQARQTLAVLQRQQRQSTAFWSAALAQTMADERRLQELAETDNTLNKLTLEQTNQLLQQLLGQHKKVFMLEPAATQA